MRKQILSLLVVLLIGSTVCMAQDRQKGKVDREKRIEQKINDGDAQNQAAPSPEQSQNKADETSSQKEPAEQVQQRLPVIDAQRQKENQYDPPHDLFLFHSKCFLDSMEQKNQ